MFDSLTERLSTTLRALGGKAKLTEDNIGETLREVRRALLEADVALSVVQGFLDAVRTRALGMEVSSALSPGQAFLKIVHEELVRVMGAERAELNLAVKPPAVILLALSATSTLQWLYRNASGTTMPNLNASIVAKIPITLPSDKDLPEVMANVSELDMTAELLKQRIIGAGSLRTELTAEIFRESN